MINCRWRSPVQLRRDPTHRSCTSTVCFPLVLQDAMFELVDSTPDIVLVIGGWNSSNTSHLQEIAEHKGLTTYWVDHPRCIEEGNKITWLTSWGEMKETENWMPVRCLFCCVGCSVRVCWVPSSGKSRSRDRAISNATCLISLSGNLECSPVTAQSVAQFAARPSAPPSQSVSCGFSQPTTALGMDGAGGQGEDRRDVGRVHPGQGACMCINADKTTSVRGTIVARAPPSYATGTAQQPHDGLRVVVGGGGCAGPCVRAEGGPEDAGTCVRRFAPVGVEGSLTVHSASSNCNGSCVRCSNEPITQPRRGLSSRSTDASEGCRATAGSAIELPSLCNTALSGAVISSSAALPSTKHPSLARLRRAQATAAASGAIGWALSSPCLGPTPRPSV